jgi:hypothetical protein
MSTDDTQDDTGGPEEGTTPTPSDSEDVQEAVEASENAPTQVQDDPGPWDEWFARAILITPFLVLLVAALGTAVLVMTGAVGFDVTIDGSISIGPLVYGFAALVGLSYVLAAAKEWGIAPVTWVASAAAGYRNDDRNDEE